MIMKKRHLKSWVLMSLLVIMLVSVISLSAYISSKFFSSLSNDNNSYVLRDIITNTVPVVSEVDDTIKKPFVDETVTVQIGYYDSESERESQENSLILYENTYMPNSGILYGCEQQFEVLAILEGEILSIEEDEIFGTIVEIKHSNDLVSKYSSLSGVSVNVGDTVNSGEVIGTSGSNKVVSVSQNMLLFELVYKGANVNPEKYYDLKLSELG